MKPLPLPVRLAAGLAATAVEQARKLPQQLVGLPVTVVSEALQLSMRVQQRVTELAIKGDDVLAVLRPSEQEPEWATFDEDEDEDAHVGEDADEGRRETAGADLHVIQVEDEDEDPGDDLDEDRDGARPPAEDPWAEEERALAAESPAALPDYDQLTLPQLRARLRTLSEADLEQLLQHERTHAARPEFTGMLTRRIANLKSGG
ncbi:lipid droplet-associated protein [Saccharothrix xinjiangensis]|uniref:Lipid droplet-associated protein n=1 Tax=Saccharothrix xinjiangensis TaxID=204798 RepID=A0ABV9Y0W6_9PSEU